MRVKIIVLMFFALSLVTGPALAKKDKEKRLPSGLEKKLERGKTLPPGWQKKMAVGEVLDREIYQQGKVVHEDRKGAFITIAVEGKFIRLIKNTREIVEILDSL